MRYLNSLRTWRRGAAELIQFSSVMTGKLEALIAAIDNQTDLLNRKFDQLFVSEDNQSDLINRKFGELIATIDNQADLLNRLVAAIDNQTDLLNRKFDQLFVSEDNQSDLINRKFGELIAAIDKRDDDRSDGGAAASSAQSFDLDTPDPDRPNYETTLTRNYPGRFLNPNCHCQNSVYLEMCNLIQNNEIPDDIWNRILSEVLSELVTIPGANQVFERRLFVQNYVKELSRKYRAHYAPGWIKLECAFFLYWLVRQAQPGSIVQCGAGNGLSSAFMMLALAKNGATGRLRIIDLPPVFDPGEMKWITERKKYGICIPEGKSSAWMIPDIYQSRVEIHNGNAKDLLPLLIDNLNKVDFFLHDSDHAYGNMMSEFRQVKRKLSQGGLIVANDILWNSAFWDFSDCYEAPAYNFKGTIGVAFF